MGSVDSVMAEAAGDHASRIARWVADVLSPPYLLIATLVLVSLHATTSLVVGLGWGLLTSLFMSVLPYGVVLAGVRRGLWGHASLPRRQDRLIPLTVTVVSVLVGLALVYGFGAPRDVLTAVLSLLVTLVLIGLITTFWKISIHLAAAAGSVAILWVHTGRVALWAVPVLMLLAWARVRTSSHTVAQVIMGTVVGVFGVLLVHGLMTG